MNSLRGSLRAWPVPLEALIVLGGAFGYSLYSNFHVLIVDRAAAILTEQHLRSLIVFEPMLLVVLGGFLLLRGWSPQRLGLAMRRTDPLVAIGLALGAYGAYVLVWMAAILAGWQPAYLNGTTHIIAGPLSLPTVIGAALINPLFEELFVCGYLITAVKERGHPMLAVNASVLLRLCYHLYQGGIGVAGVVPLGLICALWFARTGRLWPLIIAHMLMDLVGLILYVR